MKKVICIFLTSILSSVVCSADAGLNPCERQIMQAFYDDDISGFETNTSESLLYDFEKIDLDASDVEILQSYRQNEVRGDQKFYKKKIMFTCHIKEINSGIGNRPFLACGSNNDFSYVRATFKNYKKSLEKIANLNKGQKVLLVGKGNGVHVGFPSIVDCEFVDDIANKYRKQVAEAKERFGCDSKYKISEYINKYLPFIVLLCSSFSDDQKAKCSKMGEPCREEMSKIVENSKTFLSRPEFEQRLKELNIKNPYKKNEK